MCFIQNSVYFGHIYKSDPSLTLFKGCTSSEKLCICLLLLALYKLEVSAVIILVQKFQKSVQTLLINNCKHISHFLQMVVLHLCHSKVETIVGQVWDLTPNPYQESARVNQFITVGTDSFKNIPLFIPGWLQNLSTHVTSLPKTLQKHIFITRYGTKNSNIHKVGSNWESLHGWNWDPKLRLSLLSLK